jgi:hypothetical protein
MYSFLILDGRRIECTLPGSITPSRTADITLQRN